MFYSEKESCILENEKEKWKEIFLKLYKKEVHFLGYDEERHHENRYTAGKASYIERNQAMINESDYCIFYYNKNYLPQMRKYSKQDVCYYQPKRGTALAYAYAIKKKKTIVNLI